MYECMVYEYMSMSLRMSMNMSISSTSMKKVNMGKFAMKRLKKLPSRSNGIPRTMVEKIMISPSIQISIKPGLGETPGFGIRITCHGLVMLET